MPKHALLASRSTATTVNSGKRSAESVNYNPEKSAPIDRSWPLITRVYMNI
jgi:hypothetical protein